MDSFLAKEALRFEYGVTDEGLTIENVDPTPSVEQSLEKAGEHVLKMARKGFIKTLSKEATPKGIYKEAFVHLNTKRIAKQQEEAKLKKEKQKIEVEQVLVEPYQAFWHSTNTVKNIKMEFRQLPFCDPIDNEEAIIHFHEKISSIVRIMKHDGDLDTEMSKKRQSEVMKNFIIKAREIRKSIIKEALQQNKINKSKCKSDFKKEFKEFFVRKESKQVSKSVVVSKKQANSQNDELMLQAMTKQILNVPPEYMFTPFCLTEKSKTETGEILRDRITRTSRLIDDSIFKPKVAQTAPLSPKFPKIIMAEGERKRRPRILTRPATQLPSPRNKESFLPPIPSQAKEIEKKTPWLDNDPLRNVREGKSVDILQQLKSISDNFSFDLDAPPTLDDVEIPECLRINPKELESQKAELCSQQYNIKGDLWNTGLESNIAARGGEEEEAKEVDLSNPGTYTTPINMADRKFLMSQNVFMVDGEESRELVGRLRSVWDRLGFSTHQKLEMLVKYSKSVDESSKLADALKMWEQAEEICAHYESAYRRTKDELELLGNKKEASEQSFRAVEAAEENVRSIAEQLRSQFDDELMFHRKRVSELMSRRKEKLEKIARGEAY